MNWDETNSRVVTLTELNQNPQLGVRSYVDVTIATIFGQQLLVAGSDLQFYFTDASRDSADTLKDGDHARIYGSVTTQGRQRVFQIQRVKRRAVGKERHERDLYRLTAEKDASGLMELGDRMAADPSTPPPLRDEAYRSGLDLMRRQLDPNDRSGALRLSDLAESKIGDRKLALDLIVSYLPTGPDPLPSDLLDRVKRLSAVQHGPKRTWMLFEEMQQIEGLEQVDGRWVHVDRALLLRAIKEQQRSPSRGRTDLPELYAKAAGSGQILDGMTKREVVTARGFPEDFDRVRAKGRNYDAWVYGDDRLFFENDVLIKP
jgi:hypothetical protein